MKKIEGLQISKVVRPSGASWKISLVLLYNSCFSHFRTVVSIVQYSTVQYSTVQWCWQLWSHDGGGTRCGVWWMWPPACDCLTVASVAGPYWSCVPPCTTTVLYCTLEAAHHGSSSLPPHQSKMSTHYPSLNLQRPTGLYTAPLISCNYH